MTPEQLVACIDFRYLTDALDARRGARDPAAQRADARPRARPSCERDGYPAYTTSAGWLGYADDKVRRLCREAVAAGLDALQDEGRRTTPRTTCAAPRIMREEIGPSAQLMIDANQVLGRRRGDRADAARSREFDPWWIEEPTSPDDVLGHAAIAQGDRADPASRPASTARTA